MECRAQFERLLAAESHRHWRKRILLLFRELNGHGGTRLVRVIPVLFVCLGAASGVSSQTNTGTIRPRPIVTTDPELDDSNSLVRYLLYSADLQTEGLICASSQFHWRGDGKGTLFSLPNREYSRGGLSLCPCASWRWKTGERYINDAVDIYAKVYPNLKVHDPSYPTPESLESKIREGNVEFDGDTSKDTPGRR
jgi:hypothetical protein